MKPRAKKKRLWKSRRIRAIRKTISTQWRPRRSMALFSWRLREGFFTALFCLSTIPVLAASNTGTKNGNFLKLATDARGVALGGAMVTMADGADSLRWNPAGLASLESRELSATHIQYYQDVSMENVAFGYPLEESAVGGSLFYLSPGTLDGRDNFGAKTGDFQFYDLVGTVGYGQKLLTRAEGVDVQAGVAIKVVQEVIDDQSFQNPALDAGVLVSPVPEWRLGAVARNLATSKANFPMEASLGSSYTMMRIITGALDLTYAEDAPIRLSVGAEYRLEDYDSAVRIGYRTHDSIHNSEDSQITFLRDGALAGLTAGAGFEYRLPAMPSLKMDLDYAIAPFGALGISHYLTLKAKW